MRRGEINLTVEVARVHWELTAFRDQLLPALLGPCEAYLEDRAQDRQFKHVKIPLDGAAADSQFPRQRPGNIADSALKQFQEVENSGETGGLTKPPILVTSFFHIIFRFLSGIHRPALGTVTHLCPTHFVYHYRVTQHGDRQ